MDHEKVGLLIYFGCVFFLTLCVVATLSLGHINERLHEIRGRADEIRDAILRVGKASAKTGVSELVQASLDERLSSHRVWEPRVVRRERRVLMFPEHTLGPGEAKVFVMTPQQMFEGQEVWLAADRLHEIVVDDMKIGCQSQIVSGAGGPCGPTCPAEVLNGRALHFDTAQVNSQIALFVRNVGETKQVVRGVIIGDALY